VNKKKREREGNDKRGMEKREKENEKEETCSSLVSFSCLRPEDLFGNDDRGGHKPSY